MPVPAAYRYTKIFQYTSGSTVGQGWINQKGGWSESVYFSTNDQSTRFRSLCVLRAGLLPIGTYISGIRIQGVDPSGSAQLQAVNYPGGTDTTWAQDVPQMALLLSIPAVGRTNVRRFRLAAIPDSQVTYGEFKPTNPWNNAYLNYVGQLGTWSMRGRDLTQAPVLISSIDAQGNYALINNLALTPGQKVKVLRAVDSFGNAKGGVFTVESAPTLLSGKLQNWPFGACRGGSMVVYNLVYPLMNTTIQGGVISRIVQRKIGRPSLVYRGRRSRRKQ